MGIIIDTPMIDWLTFTTYNRKIMQVWKMALLGLAGSEGKWIERKKHLQYDGAALVLPSGTVYVGFGVQGKAKRKHAILTVSGSLAHAVYQSNDVPVQGRLLRKLWPIFGDSDARCTRIDLQVTNYEKENLIAGSSHWVMGRIFDAMKENGRTVSWMESEGQWGRLATVGVNARVGEVYHRIYAKPTEKGDVIRFETEYKGETAQRVATGLASARNTVGGLVRRQVVGSKSELLEKIFDCLLVYKVGKIQPMVRAGYSSTEVWLLTQVLPSLGRVLVESENSSLVAIAFWDVLQDYATGYSYDGLRTIDDVMNGQP